jgi:hypothetical protein
MINDDEMFRKYAAYAKAVQEIADAQKLANQALGQIDSATLRVMEQFRRDEEMVKQFQRDEEMVKQFQRDEELFKQFQRDEEMVKQFQRDEESRRLRTQPPAFDHTPTFQASDAVARLVKAEVARQLKERDDKSGS